MGVGFITCPSAKNLNKEKIAVAATNPVDNLRDKGGKTFRRGPAKGRGPRVLTR